LNILNFRHPELLPVHPWTNSDRRGACPGSLIGSIVAPTLFEPALVAIRGCLDRPRCFAWWAVCLCLLFIGQWAQGQGTVVFHNTGGGQPLITETRSLIVAAGLQQPRLNFAFGFATDEVQTPGSFLDSFSVTVQDINRVFTAVYVTADASGTVWAPLTPGTIVIDPASIAAVPISYPNLQPVLSDRRAYQVSAAIPPQFVGSSINVFFDLFDNLDATLSQGWFSGLSVGSVPEPQAWTLGLLALLISWGLKRRK
jgi:hypothetical protein